MSDDMTPQTKQQTFSMPLAIIVAGALIGAGLFFGLRGGTAAPIGGTPTQQAVNVKDVKTTGQPSIGNANAPLTMAYWSDYQCPFCKQFETTVLPTLKQKYVDTGKLKIVFKDYAFLGQDSVTAAEYEHAIWNLYPDKFFAWREAMFAAQDSEGDQGFGDAASIDTLIGTIAGLDDARIKADIAANKATYDQEITADQQEGASFGIQGTPGFIIGTEAIDGAQPLQSFTAAIDAQLK